MLGSKAKEATPATIGEILEDLGTIRDRIEARRAQEAGAQPWPTFLQDMDQLIVKVKTAQGVGVR